MPAGFIGERRGLEWNLPCGFFSTWKDFEHALKWAWPTWFACATSYAVWWIVALAEGETEKEETEEDCASLWQVTRSRRESNCAFGLIRRSEIANRGVCSWVQVDFRPFFRGSK